jgi:hypothetical protein
VSSFGANLAFGYADERVVYSQAQVNPAWTRLGCLAKACPERGWLCLREKGAKNVKNKFSPKNGKKLALTPRTVEVDMFENYFPTPNDGQRRLEAVLAPEASSRRHLGDEAVGYERKRPGVFGEGKRRICM